MSLDSLLQALVTRLQTEFNSHKALISGKEPSLPGGGTVSQYLRGDKTWQDYIQSTNAGFVNSISTANHVLSGLQTVGGVVIGAGGRVLLNNQTDGKENGIWLVGSGAWVRVTDANTSARLAGYVAVVSQGTQIGSAWKTTFKSTDTIGVNNVRFYRSAVEMVSALSFPVPALHGQHVLDLPNEMPYYWDSVGLQWVSANGVRQVTNAQRLAIATPARDMIVRETDTGLTYMWDGTTWQSMFGTETTLHRCHVRRTAAQALAASSTTILFDTEIEDTSNMWDAGSPGVVTIPTAGRYMIIGEGSSTQSTGTYILQLLINGVGGTVGTALVRSAGSGSQPTKYTASQVLTLAAGDTVSLTVFAAASTTTGTVQYDSEFVVIKLPDSQVVVSKQVQAACQIHKGVGASAQAAVASNTVTACTFDSIRYDTDSMADTANNRIVIQHEGIYRLTGALAWAGPGNGGIRTTAIYLNGVEVAAARNNASTSGGSYGNYAQITLDLNVGDVITLQANQLQAPAATLALLNDTAYRCWLAADIISDTVF